MNNTSRMTVRQFVYSNGAEKGSFDGTPGATVTKTMTMKDAAQVTTRYCYVNAVKACVSAPVATGSTLTVICPAGGQPATQEKVLTDGQRADFAAVRFAKGTEVKLSFSVLGKTYLLDDLTQNM